MAKEKGNEPKEVQVDSGMITLVPPTLKEKLWLIMQDVEYINKDKVNSFHGYKYASEETIKKIIHEALVKHRVLFRISVDQQEVKVVEPVKVGDKPEFLTLLSCRYIFEDVDSEQVITAQMQSQGQDKGDKGVYKAITGAIKYALTSALLIPTGDDPEDDKNDKPSQAAAASKMASASGEYIDSIVKEVFKSDIKLSKRVAPKNSSRPGEAYWHDEVKNDFHSWVSENPDADPMKVSKRVAAD
jgi:hypothetical protein